MGIAACSFAKLAIARRDKLVPKRARLSFEEAAAAPISDLTALQAIRDVGKVQPDQRVLVIGAGGGVGSLTVQVANAFGAEVTGVAARRRWTWSGLRPVKRNARRRGHRRADRRVRSPSSGRS
jgi:NADPH:quinone reductase-like Zn-dependent oxidoreductase